LVTFVVTQNLGSIIFCQLKRVKGRSAALHRVTNRG
jgi:hypothetical protein